MGNIHSGRKRYKEETKEQQSVGNLRRLSHVVTLGQAIRACKHGVQIACVVR